MTSSILTDLLIGLVVIVALCSRRLRWRPVDGTGALGIVEKLIVVG